ncbi:MAG: hypothetical protein P1P88_06560 [Bacteroidales bacterium]|nr:hypothetical protein [Bacteroidales bacterium]
MINRYTLILLFGFFSSANFAQNNGNLTEGKVSFVTSNNVYVRFNNTSTIYIGDTLQLAENN